MPEFSLRAHPLTPLLAPRSLVLMTGPEDQRSGHAEQLLAHLKAQRFDGELTVLDVQLDRKSVV